MTQNPADNLRAEFSHHISRHAPGPFLLSAQTASAIEKFVRETESKRLAGTISGEETDQSRQLEELQENIAKFNANAAASELTPSSSPPSLTARSAGGREGEKDTEEPVIIPQISSQEADKIIAGINEQFEEKVMKKIRPPAMPVLLKSEPAAEPETGDEERGTDLQDYLRTIKAERPNIPFADSDSQMDLAKLVNRQK